MRPAGVAEDAPFITKCSPSKKVRRVLRIGCQRLEAGESSEHGRRPLPTIADEIVNAPCTHTVGVRSHGNGIPQSQHRSCRAPTRQARRPTDSDAHAPRGFRTRPDDTRPRSGDGGPSRTGICGCLRVAHVHRPCGRKRDLLKQAVPVPVTVAAHARRSGAEGAPAAATASSRGSRTLGARSHPLRRTRESHDS